jgi:hypothetical protein
VGSDPTNFNDPSGAVRCHIERQVREDNFVYARVQCWSTAGDIVGDKLYNVNRLADPKEEHRVLAMANAEFKAADANDWQLVPEAASRAIAALTRNKECLELFGTAQSRAGRWNPANVITSMFVRRDGQFGRVDFEYSGVGVAETRPAGFVLPSFNRNLIQASRANISIHRNYWNAGDDEANAQLILHELGHVYNFTRGSGGFAIGNLSEAADPYAFDKVINEKCHFK